MDAASKAATADTWRERIVAQQASGQSIRAWCRQNACHEHAFYWWRAKLGLSPTRAVKGQPRSARLKFAEVVVDPSPAAGQMMTLRLRGGQELMLPPMAIQQVADLVRAIEGVA
jgi:hypothetical protein